MSRASKFTAVFLGGLLLMASCAPAAVTPQATITQTPSTAAAQAPVITPGAAPVITPSTATVPAPVTTPVQATVTQSPVFRTANTTTTTPTPTPAPAPTTQIKWLGHSTFLLTSANGTKILIDPLNAGSTRYAIATIYDTDAVTVSHEHGDHNNVAMAGSSALIIRGLTGTGANQTWSTVNQTVKGVRITSISPVVPMYHDNVSGAQRGRNTVFIYEVDGLRIVHMGDLGHTLSPAAVQAIGRADVILIPVGGFYTIDAVDATTVVGQLNPKVVIPMHYKTAAQSANWPGVGVDAFLTGKTVVRVQSTTIRLTPATLPAQTTVMIPLYED